MTKNADYETQNTDYKVKAGLPLSDVDLTPREADALSQLFRTAVIHVEGRDLGRYYGDIFDLAVGRMRAIEPVVTREEFVTTVVDRLNGEYAPLRDSSRLVKVDANDAEHDVQNTLDDAVKQFAGRGSHLPEEAETLRYEFCRLQGGHVGVFRDGSVFVRRSSAVATALQQVGGLGFDGSKVIRQTTAEQRTAPCQGYPQSTSQADLLKSISTICSALTYVPEIGAVAGFIKGVINIVDTLFGTSNQSQVQAVLEGVGRIIKEELEYDEVRRQMANVKAWADTLYTLHIGLANVGSHPESFIDIDYMPALSHQVNAPDSGTVFNSLEQLESLWDSTSWSEMDLREDILRAMVLALSHQVTIYRDRVLLCAWMVASGDPKYKNLLEGYHAEYTAWADPKDTRLTPITLKDMIKRWMEMRRYQQDPQDHYYNHGSDYYGIAYNHRYDFLGEVYWVEDHGRRDSQGRLPGEPWYYKSGGVFNQAAYESAHRCAQCYQRSIDDEIRDNMVPLIARCDDMVSDIKSLKI